MYLRVGYSGDEKGNLALWDVFTRRMIGRKISAHGSKETKGGVLQLVVLDARNDASPVLMSQGRDGVIKFWQVESSSEQSGGELAPALVLHEAWTLNTSVRKHRYWMGRVCIAELKCCDWHRVSRFASVLRLICSRICLSAARGLSLRS